MIIAIPLPIFIQVQLPLKKKIILCGIFGLGMFTVGLTLHRDPTSLNSR